MKAEVNLVVQSLIQAEVNLAVRLHLHFLLVPVALVADAVIAVKPNIIFESLKPANLSGFFIVSIGTNLLLSQIIYIIKYNHL